MTDVGKHFQIPFEPVADPAAVVLAPEVRFTVLASRLLRLEYSPDEQFEDRPTQTFWYRRQPVPPFEVARSRELLEITTEHLILRYRLGSSGFTPDSLSIELLDAGNLWRYGDTDAANLLGTARTLDQSSGRLELEPGLLSRSGWALVDDSQRPVFGAQGWVEGRSSPASPDLDLYFFGYGRAYLDCLRDFCRIAGAVPLIPRWALGNWWSRFWAYTQEELVALMREFEAHEVPLSVCVVDMDWHITQTGYRRTGWTGYTWKHEPRRGEAATILREGSTGWTGYTWNRELFPDPEGLMAWLHRKGLRVTLCLHPHEGVHPHESKYVEMAEAMEMDPAGQKPVPFDLPDPRFARAYFEILHHPLEQQGVDFWWIDWQQGSQTKLPGLDPLWWLNHTHFQDLGRDGIKRPFIFSRWGGLGNHRYPIGFSGDTFATWDSLAAYFGANLPVVSVENYH